MTLLPIKLKSSLDIEIKEVDDLNKIKQDWQQLEEFCTNIFLTWIWIGPWLTSVHKKTTIYSISFHSKNGGLVGMAFLTKDTIKRRVFFTIKTISLNETNNRNTQYIIEHNDILCNQSFKKEIYAAFFELLKKWPYRFDELQLHALNNHNKKNIKSLCVKNNFNYLCEKTSTAYYVDLSIFNKNPDNYTASLSKNKREQIRRSIKYLKQFGDMNLSIAESTEQALSFFDSLGKLHQQYWVAKGQPGSFSNKNWRDFHTEIIRNNLMNTQLIRLSFGSHIVGYLYNLIDSHTSYSIQSGFNYGSDNNNRPGLILHYYAICYAISNNKREYDFLAGDAQYKRSLSNAYRNFSWIQIQNPSIIITMENLAVRLFRSLKKTTSRITLR